MKIAVIYNYQGKNPDTGLPFHGTGRTLLDAGLTYRGPNIQPMRWKDVLKVEELALAICREAVPGVEHLFMSNYYWVRAEDE